MTRGLSRLTATAGLVGLAFSAGAAQQPQVTAKIEKVLVYSTQARVYQGAWMTLDGKTHELPLVDLPSAARHDSVRVTSKTADVVRVQVAQTRGQLPRQARTEGLIKKIEQAMDRLQDLTYERQVLETEVAFVRGLGLRREPRATRAPQDGLFADVWRRILTWMDGRTARARARLQTLARERRDQEQALHKLRVEAASLDLGMVNQPVHQVLATLRGRPGKHKVTVSYLVDGVTWLPSYDLRYNAGRRIVEATYYAEVSQSTGEDWDKVQLRFSTAMPMQLLAIPELPTWTVGRKRDFMPTPRRQDDPAPSPWVPPEPQVPVDPVVQHLQRLLGAPMDKTGEVRRDAQPDRDADGILDEEDRTISGELARPDGKALPSPRPAYRPAPRKRAFNFDDAERKAPAAPPAEPMPSAGAAAKAPPPQAPRLEALALREAPAVSRSSVFDGRRSYTPTESLPWTEEGYRPPAVNPDLPAAAAKGYRFTLYAPGKHSVPASGKRQRVPVLRKELKVHPYYRVVPGASSYAYLMAEVQNTTGRPILRGHANLFTGDMFSGRSWLNTSLPGKTIKLPLGVDDSLKVERHARQRTVVEGMIFKDDVSEYTVEIEIANHHRYAVEVELEDQIPVADGRKIEVKAFSSTPKMDKPDDKGMVTWKGTIKPSAVQKLKLTFRIVRPKDWELRQHDG